MTDDLRVISDTYDLILWSDNHSQRFPRASKFSIGTRIEQKLLDVLDALITAKFSKDKSDSLHEASLAVEHLRFLYRLCKDKRLLSLKSHGFACRQLTNIGRQVNAWRSSVATR